MKLDPAVIELLRLNPEMTSVSSIGGGCSAASAAKITVDDENNPDGGRQKRYFMKSASGKDAEVMFAGEHASLNAIHNAIPTLAPKSLGYGRFSADPSTFFLVTDFLDITSKRPSPTALPLAAKLRKLHTTPAPIPPGYDRAMFGFPVTTCCGDTPQDNSFKDSWADFYANNRLRFILRRSEASNGSDGELRDLVESTATKVVPRLLGDGHLGGPDGIQPVVVHGDLWSGNAARGRIGTNLEVQEVIYDSSACYAHNEYELGIMRMFGGFGGNFLEQYHRLCPKTPPVEEYDDRVALYELYHHLNHYALFGGGYKSSALKIMHRLMKKYGESG